MKSNENPPASIGSRILYQSEACVVINKLQGEAMEGAGQGMIDMGKELAQALSANCCEPSAHEKPALPKVLPVAVHRIDVPVTGCALFALTKNALSFLSGAFAAQETTGVQAERKVEKHYWAIVEKPQKTSVFNEKDELIHWITFDKAKNKSFAHNEAGPGRKKAVLHYKLLGEGKNYLFFEIELFTGRHHQIRAQFAKIGLHIKGDLKYGAKRSENNGGIRLHARSLSIPNPLSGKIINVKAAPPVLDNLWQAFPG